MKKKNMKTDDPLLEIAEGLTRQLFCYVKERKKIGEFDISEINPDKDGICRRVDVGIEEFSRGNKHVWIFIEFENGTQKGTLFHGNCTGIADGMCRATVVYDNGWGVLVMDVALLLGINSTFLLYRKERMSIIPIAIFTLLFGYVVLSGAFENTIFRMGEYPSIVLKTKSIDNEYIITTYNW